MKKSKRNREAEMRDQERQNSTPPPSKYALKQQAQRRERLEMQTGRRDAA